MLPKVVYQSIRINSPSLKTRNFFLRRELKKIKTRTDFRENFENNKNPRAQRANFLGGVSKIAKLTSKNQAKFRAFEKNKNPAIFWPEFWKPGAFFKFEIWKN